MNGVIPYIKIDFRILALDSLSVFFFENKFTANKDDILLLELKLAFR